MDKLVDWYGKHKVGTRLAMITITLVYAVLLLGAYLSDKTLPAYIYESAMWVFIFTYSTTLLGANTAERLMEIYRDIRLGSKLADKGANNVVD